MRARTSEEIRRYASRALIFRAMSQADRLMKSELVENFPGDSRGNRERPAKLQVTKRVVGGTRGHRGWPTEREAR